VRLFRPVPSSLARPLTFLVFAAWAAAMVLLVRRSYLQTPVALAADLAQYGTSAQWKGIYYRGEKIGFSVGQTAPVDGGYELKEDGRIQLTLLGASSAIRLHSTVRVDEAFGLRDFAFSLDPGTGPTEIRGALAGRKLELTIKSASGERSETRELAEAPVLSMSFPRRLAASGGLASGRTLRFPMFDPTTLRNAPMEVTVGAREVVDVGGRPTPAFKVATVFAGIAGTSWITDVGEVVREESPMGMMVVRETAQQAQAMAVPGRVQADLLEAAAIVPEGAPRIDDPASVERLRVRLVGAEALAGPDLQGAGQRVEGDLFDVRDPRTLTPTPLDPDARSFLAAEPFLESDAPEIRAETEKALGGVEGDRARAERLVRHVHSIVDKKPTVSLPSALEVLRTRVGDCNEHTALYVAMARAAGLPARIAVGLVAQRSAFYYHAWAEVYLTQGGRGLWLPVDPTLNQFPADATHIRLARGGLDRQAAILGLVGKAKMTVVEMKLAPGATPVLVGQTSPVAAPFEISLPRREASGRSCWSSPARR
jgi:transglutaminase-like putative cysteine protease